MMLDGNHNYFQKEMQGEKNHLQDEWEIKLLQV